jgi:hypothetical protein
MFQCGITKKRSKLGEKPYKIVVEKRERVYKRKFRDEDGNVEEVIVGRGWEIVKEILASKEGYDLWIAEHGTAE